MNRRRFLGLAAVAPLAALGTRVPEPAAPSFEDAHAAGFQDGLAAAENAALASETERIQALVDAVLAHPERYPDLMARVRGLSGLDASPMSETIRWVAFQDGYAAAESAHLGYWAYPDGSVAPVDPDYLTVTGVSAWDFDDLMAAQAASRPGVLYERFTQDAEIAAMARRDRERGA